MRCARANAGMKPWSGYAIAMQGWQMKTESKYVKRGKSNSEPRGARRSLEQRWRENMMMRNFEGFLETNDGWSMKRRIYKTFDKKGLHREWRKGIIPILFSVRGIEGEWINDSIERGEIYGGKEKPQKRIFRAYNTWSEGKSTYPRFLVILGSSTKSLRWDL